MKRSSSVIRSRFREILYRCIEADSRNYVFDWMECNLIASLKWNEKKIEKEIYILNLEVSLGHKEMSQ